MTEKVYSESLQCNVASNEEMKRSLKKAEGYDL
jgi:hypothetical protein